MGGPSATGKRCFPAPLSAQETGADGLVLINSLAAYSHWQSTAPKVAKLKQPFSHGNPVKKEV